MTEETCYCHARKLYLDVAVVFHADGRLEPKSVVWEDGRSYAIDAVADVRPAASLKAGGCGMRYTCRIRGRLVYLFLEDNNRWFMERSCSEGCENF